MDGKSRKLESAKGVVNTLSCDTGPRAPLLSNLDDPEEWEIPYSDAESVGWDEAHCMEPFACRTIIKCGTTDCTGLVRHLWWDMGIQRVGTFWRR